MSPDPVQLPDVATAPHPPYDQTPYPVFPPQPVPDDEVEDLNAKIYAPEAPAGTEIPPP